MMKTITKTSLNAAALVGFLAMAGRA